MCYSDYSPEDSPVLLSIGNGSGTYWWEVNIGLGYGLVPSGNKPLPVPNVGLGPWHNMAPLGHNELSHWL